MTDGAAHDAGDKQRDAHFMLTSRCLVTVRIDGLQLQGPIEAPPLLIGLPELELLAALEGRPVASPAALDSLVEEVAGSTGADPAGLAEFAKRLRRSQRLIRGSKVARRDLADHPSVDNRQPFDLDTSQRVVLRLPLVLRLHRGRYEIIDHHGLRAVVLTPVEVSALETLIHPVLPRYALVEQRSRHPNAALNEPQFARLLGQLGGADLLRTMDAASLDAPVAEADRAEIVRAVFDRHAEAQTAAERERERRTGTRRTKVIPVAFDMGAPAGLGMVIAFARAHESGRLEECYNFRTDWVWSDDRLDEFTAEPAIYLFSSYLWSHARCIAVSEQVKERSPQSITIHGGPDVPKYEHDARAYFAAHPHVDIAIRGEGELSAAETLAALAAVIGDPKPDLSVLAGIPGITYRDGHRVVRNPDRERIADVNSLSSPFLTGLYDVFADVPETVVTIETNRGCPYSCTFCDWGSATNSRVRQFDIDRLFAEFEWCSRTRVESISLADANFGILKRDVEIAQQVADLKLANGYPQGFGTSFAKNTVKHLQEIIKILAEAGILTQGVLSLQSMDQTTLDAIHRSNIKTERYDQLASEMRHAHLPLMVELMMGLPGQTLATFADDLQQCIDREVPARINATTLLVNSPMNDPEYLTEHQIETAEPLGPGTTAILISTSSFTREDFREMEKLRLAYAMYENFGVLRQVSRFVRQAAGMREIDFYRNLHAGVQASPETWPALHALVQFGTSMMTAPMSWALVMDELRDFLVSEVRIADDAALEAVLRTQHALLPAYGRQFPEVVALQHDVIGWHHAMIAAKAEGHRTDWPELVPRLGEYGPTELVVDDPDHVVDTSLGLNRELGDLGVNWELDSPLSRTRLAASELVEWSTRPGAVARHVQILPGRQGATTRDPSQGGARDDQVPVALSSTRTS